MTEEIEDDLDLSQSELSDATLTKTNWAMLADRRRERQEWFVLKAAIGLAAFLCLLTACYFGVLIYAISGVSATVTTVEVQGSAAHENGSKEVAKVAVSTPTAAELPASIPTAEMQGSAAKEARPKEAEKVAVSTPSLILPTLDWHWAVLGSFLVLAPVFLIVKINHAIFSGKSKKDDDDSSTVVEAFARDLVKELVEFFRKKSN